MKRLIYAILGLAVVGIGIGVYGSRSGKPVASAQPVTESLPSPALEDTQRVKPLQLRRVSAEAPGHLGPTAHVALVLSEAAPDDALVFNQAIETLVSTQSKYPQKEAAWKQLRDTGKLDQAISELEQRAAGNPQAAEYSATLGRAYLEKAGAIQDMRQQGILGMKADLAFDDALKIDPNNFEARFTKAVAMSYWPPQLNKGQEVIDHFTQLISQQEAGAPQPEFAQTYVWLGDQYQKAGNTEYARQVWQRGAALYPNDSTLPKRLSDPAAR